MRRVREHFALMAKGAIATTGVGSILGVVGLVQLLSGRHHTSGWIFVAAGFCVLFLSQIWAVQKALTERDAARASVQSVNQQLIHMSEGAAIPGRISMDRIHMSTAAALGPAAPKRRWFSRLLSDEEREDLANRCEACSREVVEFLTRPEPPSPGFFRPRDPTNPADVEDARIATQRAREQHDLDRDVYKQETEQRLQAEFVPRMRDLLNECAEAGYALDEVTESFRRGEDAHWFDRLNLAQSVGVLAHRVRRRAKRI